MKTIATHKLTEQVHTPDYDRGRFKTKMVHLGFGAFHRGHQALYTDELASKAGSDWGYCEVNLFGGEQLLDMLRSQDHLYTVVEKSSVNTTARVVGSIRESLHPSLDGKHAILEKMAEPQVAIVSMTITEKGYCIDPATGSLDRFHPLIIHDVENPSKPESAIGYIVEALRLRRQRSRKPFTVMSCDNLQENGRIAKTAIVEYANMLDLELGEWIESNVTFPSTMVDRIVPAVNKETLNEISGVLGCYDPCGVLCEDFRQWVIEDNFVADRPDWNLVGAEFVENVVPYEEMKLRMLNGTHSFLAYLGYLGGYKHISDAMENDYYHRAASEMMKSQAASLDMPEGTDLNAYARLLIERFSNPNLKHQTWQIAMDGSQKIPQRFAGSLKYHLEQGSNFSWLATAIAAWMRYVSGQDEQGNDIDVVDPMREILRGVCDVHGKCISVVPALLSIESIFPPELGRNPQVIGTVSAAYQSLIDNGSRETVAQL
ncbi:mannitol dehydrogenase family protein [Vibrio atypicus]|uniref:mannitol dehydrogenase family protein n=1 Tax=Vibrio atypicus TaxID=558271 RepID=UPI003736C9B9